jgi:type II secretory pathway component PulC
MGSLFEQPKLTSIKTREVLQVGKKEEAIPQNLKLIYEEHDLFDTFRPAVTPVKPVDTLPTIPLPPQAIPVQIQKTPQIQFLPPLPLKITGIIASSNETQSQVSFLNTSSLKTESLRIGDKILDAYILRIFPRKVIVIRSNGQQETIYMYGDEAKKDTTSMQDTRWTDIVQRQDPYFLVNPVALGSRVHSLAEFIDMLNITTASKQGEPVGIRIGEMAQTSLGRALGFMPGDIITKILDEEPSSTQTRMKLFNDITSLNLGSRIPVEILRNNRTITYTYILFNLADPSVTLEEERPMASAAPANNSFANTMAIPSPHPSTRKKDLDAMRMFGGRPDKGNL